MRCKALLTLLILLPILLLIGCQTTPPPVVRKAGQSFPIRGKIVVVDPAGSITLDHEAVPGFMAAMIMPYKLRDPAIVSELHPGDRIAAKIVIAAEPNARPVLDQIVVIAQARPDYKPAVQYHVPAAGDQVPNFALLNQSGKTIHLAQFRGKILLATFIYTRCQLSDFCPRMSRNFADIDHALAADPALYAQTHLLSISFDPTYDTPTVLRTYGGSYTGLYAKETFNHWDFAAPSLKDLPAIEHFFDLGVTPGDNQSLNHSSSTILIGKDGKVAAFFPTNEWKTEELLAQVKQAANSSAKGPLPVADSHRRQS